MYSLLRPFLFQLPPEAAHDLAMQALHGRLAVAGLHPPPTAAAKTVMGLHFPNPIGIAAGLDKNAEHIDALATLGFGFVEVGGVTPQPQPGNLSPRIFRLPAQHALINRMGFNNNGADAIAKNLAARRYRAPLAVNLGKNATTPNDSAADDYRSCLRILYPHADFFVLNISSPNTANLRDLQQAAPLKHLLEAVIKARDALADTHGKRAPLAIKISPDLGDDGVRAIADIVTATGVDGVTAVNTTTTRPPDIAAAPDGEQEGGLSGKPLAARATEVVRILREALPAEKAIIGVGGIDSVETAKERLAAGADLLQIYTGLIYQGARLPMRLINALRS